MEYNEFFKSLIAHPFILDSFDSFLIYFPQVLMAIVLLTCFERASIHPLLDNRKDSRAGLRLISVWICYSVELKRNGEKLLFTAFLIFTRSLVGHSYRLLVFFSLCIYICSPVWKLHCIYMLLLLRLGSAARASLNVAKVKECAVWIYSSINMKERTSVS